MEAPARTLRRHALLAASLLVGCSGSGSGSDAPDASQPAVAARTSTLALARELAAPELAVADVLQGRLAVAPEGSGLAVVAKTPGDLELHVAATAKAPTWIGTDRDHAISLSIDGASDAAVEADGGAAVHREVLPGTDAIWATTEARAELLFLLRDGASPHVRLHLEKGAGLEAPVADQGGLTFRDARGNARLHVPAPVALDAHGVRRVAQMSLAVDGTLAIDLDDSGLAHPILLDPAVLQARWTNIGDRQARTMGSLAWDPGRAKLIGFGGYQKGSYNEPGAAATGLFAYTFPGRTFDALATGPGAFTSAMLGGPPFYDYAWFAAFDADRGKLVAIGSNQYECASSCTAFNRMEVHEWDSATNTWTQRCTTGACPTSAPSAAQTGVEVIYDANRKLTLVCNTSSRACSTWNGATGTWGAIASFPVVGMRRGFYDAKYGAATFLGSDGTYSWNGASWIKRTTSTLYPLGVTYDTIRKRAVALVGNGLNSDTYEWDGTSAAWTLIVSATSSTPYAKAHVAMGFDPVNGRVVAWGGGDGQQGYYSFDFISAVFEYQAFGNACAGDVDCLGGSCRDGFCCDTKCGACRRCDGPGAGGVCAPFAGAASTGTEHDTCTGDNACNTAGECKLKNGKACTSGTQCVSGACVDGFCCSTPCNQACEVCNATPGTCTPAAKGSSGRTSCGVGICNGVSRTCSTSCATDADCSAGGWCNAGTCTATLGAGLACTRDRQCATGSCRDGVCCNGGCNGPCEACTVAKGASANGVCTALPASTKPPACGGYACSGTSGACATSCTTDAGCGAGYYCDGAFCQKARAQGDGCARTEQCASGLTCADGVCCNSACDGVCQACSAANKQSGDAPGVCGPAKAGSDPGDRCPTEDSSTCGKSGVCSATGTCASWPKGAACGSGIACESGAAKGRTCDGLGTCVTDTTGTACAPGTCSTTTGCTFTCTTDAECDATGFCDAGTCKARAASGRTCTANNQCASGFCVDGVCCSSACSGVCEACNGVGTEGTCTAIAGPPREGHGACPGASGDDPCTAAACDGETRDACKAFAGPEITCRAASCVDAVASVATKCDGTGKCPAASTKACAPFGCAGAKCAETCTADEACAKGNRCDTVTGKCVSNGTCDGDHTVIGADGTKTDCSPFKCDDGGCKSTCASSDECAAPAICDGTKCVATTAALEDSGGCATSSRPTRGSFLVAALVAALAARRRSARRERGACEKKGASR